MTAITTMLNLINVDDYDDELFLISDDDDVHNDYDDGDGDDGFFTNNLFRCNEVSQAARCDTRSSPVVSSPLVRRLNRR